MAVCRRGFQLKRSAHVFHRNLYFPGRDSGRRCGHLDRCCRIRMLQLVPGISDKSLRQLQALEAPLNPDCETTWHNCAAARARRQYDRMRCCMFRIGKSRHFAAMQCLVGFWGKTQRTFP